MLRRAACFVASETKKKTINNLKCFYRGSLEFVSVLQKFNSFVFLESNFIHHISYFTSCYYKCILFFFVAAPESRRFSLSQYFLNLLYVEVIGYCVIKSSFLLIMSHFREESDEFVEIGALNGLFVLGRSIGFIGK